MVLISVIVREVFEKGWKILSGPLSKHHTGKSPVEPQLQDNQPSLFLHQSGLNKRIVNEGMGNLHGVSSIDNMQRRALIKQLVKHSPLRLCYVCRHGKCKRIVDLMVTKNRGEDPTFVLGNTLRDGKFEKSHFRTTKLEWVGNTLIISGGTPNGSASIELKNGGHHFLSGSIKYEHTETRAFKKMDLHVHLHAATYGACISKFGSPNKMRTRSSKSVELSRSRSSVNVKQEGEEDSNRSV